MFFTYIRRELRRRSKQAILVALGLAIGIGLVVTVSAASAGVKNADGQVLHSLDGVGTDMTITKTATFSTSGPQHFGFAPGTFDKSTAKSAHISRNSLRATIGEATLPDTDVSKVASLKGAAGATGGLELTDTSFSGTLPTFSGGSGGFGGGAPGGASFNINSFTVDGVQITSSGIGPLAPSEITKGRYFSSADKTADVAIASSSYAKTKDLKIGSTVDVAGKSVKVIGLADTPSSTADVFLPLGTAQTLSGDKSDVTTIYVSATSASDVSSLASEVGKAVPKSTVSTSASLAKEVTGSLSSTTSLLDHLGTWISVAALAIAVLIAALLMMAAVSRRVREFGTLKAIGWRTRRIVGQVMGEGLVLGIVGGIAGLVLGIAGAEVISTISPGLTATVGSSVATGGGFGGFGGGAGFGGGSGFARASGGFHHAGADAARTVLVHLGAPLQADTIVLAVVLAIAGGLIAGAFGSWRAARLRPAAALRSVE